MSIQAFPTAQGAAKYARGNTTYTIAEVTNLNSSGSGSFWSALGDNTIVVFRVSGIIDIGTLPTSTRSFTNCIVLGQTAPQGGITFVSNGWKFGGVQNTIFRYCRFRVWQCRSDINDPCGVDNIDVVGLNGNVNTNIIFDHCSFAYGGDEFVSFRGDTDTITVQNCLFSYGKTGMLAGDSDDTTRGEDFSILGNLWHTIGKRTPNPNTNGRIDVIGNVTYNILNTLMRTGGSIQLNEIGNYYTEALPSPVNFSNGWTPLIHTSNNRWGSTITANGQDNTQIYSSWLSGRDPISSDFTSTAYTALNYDNTLPDGDESRDRVTNREMGCNAYLNDSGVLTAELDDLDIEAYDEFDSNTKFDWTDGVTSNRTQGNWELIPQRSWLTDNESNFGVIVNEHSQTTHTGVVPNTWITSKGLNPATFNPLGNDLDATYTNIEVYSFGVDNQTIKAFPTAEGFGKNTIGGRGGSILFVDNLNDSGAGSLREACEASGARIVIFRVGGIITLTSTINIDNPNITIAFQTAPGNGIMISAEGTPNIPLIRVRTSQVIMRYPRFRRSASDTTETNSDCLVLTEGTDNCIIDHMSTSSAADEVLSIIGYSGDGDVDTKNITIQNSIIGKGYGGTTKGCLVSGAVDRLSFYRNLWVSNGQRNVLIKNDAGDGATAETTFEFVNNVIYDAKFKTSITCGDSSTGQKRLNYVNNIYFEQSGGADQRRMIMVDNVDLPDTDVSIYALGNISPTRLTITTPTDFDEEWDITQGTDNNGGDTDLSSPSAYSRADASFQSTTAHSTPILDDGITLLDAVNVFNSIKNSVGASIPYRDNYDTARVSDVENLEQTFNPLSEPYQTYSSGTYPTDSNNDGIPDSYTTANMGTDSANDTAPSGYTWIEEYINSLSSNTDSNPNQTFYNITQEERARNKRTIVKNIGISF